ncbi:MAG: 2-phosphosulfolactate phosphatase [Ilumatobacteraceae bacterium]
MQDGFAYRFDWGPSGLRALAPCVEVVVIVDVLRFTSAVSAAIESGCEVLPYRWADEGAAAFAAEHEAELAGVREQGGVSLSPTDLLGREASGRIVLPSPNGSALAFAAVEHGARQVLAGCLRNATATARAARALAAGGPIAVIAAGERWHGATGPIRSAVEDLIGAGAVLAALDPAAAATAPACSPEAAAARAAFVAARPRLHETLRDCTSGRQLVERGWDDDVANCAALDVTALAAHLDGDTFRAFPPPAPPR